ncbi:MAG TPA: glycosyltransferase [bacterium]|nr:glycosyltransferase [bacterium]
MNEEVVKIVENFKPDYIIYLSGYYEFTLETLKKLREKSILIGWFFDDEFRFENYTKYYLPYFDFFVTHSIEAIEKYENFNVNVIHVLPSDGVPFYPDWDKKEEIYDVSFIGFKTEDRERYINYLKNLNLNIFLAGYGWEKYLTFNEMNEVFRKSKINLCFTKTFNNKRQWKGRIFEVMLQGGFMLTEYVTYLEKYFEIGKEIDCFDNEKELVDKVKYYLKNEKKRKEIAKNGWKKCIENYTPYHRMLNVFLEIEKKVNLERKQFTDYEIFKRRLKKNYSDYYIYMCKAFILSGHKRYGWETLILAFKNNFLNYKIYLYCLLTLIPFYFFKFLLKFYKNLKKTIKK